MHKKILIFGVIIGMSVSILCSCGKGNVKNHKNTETATEDTSDTTVVGESGKRYEMDTTSSLNTETDEGFHEYSQLQKVLNDITKQTSDEDAD